MLIYLLLVVGFALLIKGADFLVDGSSSIARKLNVSDLIIGLTIVAFGTSAPELCVNIISSIKGTADTESNERDGMEGDSVNVLGGGTAWDSGK
jgi:cation:H+ antiporter